MFLTIKVEPGMQISQSSQERKLAGRTLYWDISDMLRAGTPAHSGSILISFYWLSYRLARKHFYRVSRISSRALYFCPAWRNA